MGVAVNVLAVLVTSSPSASSSRSAASAAQSRQPGAGARPLRVLGAAAPDLPHHERVRLVLRRALPAAPLPAAFRHRRGGRASGWSAIPRGEGLLFVTAHIGHWETASHLMPAGVDRDGARGARGGASIRGPRTSCAACSSAMAAPATRPTSRRTTRGLGTGPRGRPPAGPRGRAAGRPAAHGRPLPHRATLFGRPMPLPVGPAALARAASVSAHPRVQLPRRPAQLSGLCARPIRVRAEGDRDARSPRPRDRLAPRSSGRSGGRHTSGSASTSSGLARIDPAPLVSRKHPVWSVEKATASERSCSGPEERRAAVEPRTRSEAFPTHAPSRTV